MRKSVVLGVVSSVGPQVLCMLSCRGCGMAVVDCMFVVAVDCCGGHWWTPLGDAYVMRGPGTSFTATEDPNVNVACRRNWDHTVPQRWID